MSNTERIANALENIEKSLSTLAEDAKANRKLREENEKMFSKLEQKLSELAEDPFGLDKRN